MKKMVLIIIVFLAAGTISAQAWNNQWNNNKSVTIEGILQLHNSQMAVLTEDAFFYVPLLRQYAGFIEGLREGALISITGYPSGNIFHPSAFTVNGNSYNLQAPAFAGIRNGLCFFDCFCGGGLAAGRGFMGRRGR